MTHATWQLSAEVTRCKNGQIEACGGEVGKRSRLLPSILQNFPFFYRYYLFSSSLLLNCPLYPQSFQLPLCLFHSSPPHFGYYISPKKSDFSLSDSLPIYTCILSFLFHYVRLVWLCSLPWLFLKISSLILVLPVNLVSEEVKMPGILTNGFEHNERPNDSNGSPSPCKETATPNPIKPQRSSLSPQSPQNSGPNIPVLPADTSIEELYQNVCDMESSDHSPSRQSSESDGNESRIDSELCHLVGGTMREVEIMEEEVAERSTGDSVSETSSRKETSANSEMLEQAENEKTQCEKLVRDDEKTHCEMSVEADEKIQSANTSSASSENSNKVPNSQVDIIPETPPKSKPKGKSPHAKPPTDKRNDKPLRKQNNGATRVKKSKNSPSKRLMSQNQSENSTESTSDKPEMGPVLLKQARDLISSGDNPRVALELALRAMRLFEKHADGKPSLELVMCLHVTAAIYSSLGQYHEAIPLLEHSIEIPLIEEGQDHALAKFAGHMQLGDTYAMLGQVETSIMCYNTGLEVQRKVLGETDPRFGETCRYVAEANVQALQFDEAERLCQMALDIHRANGSPPTLEEAADRRLMGLICETKGNHEAALEHLILASMAMVANGQEVEVASVDCSIGDTYLSLSRYDEAIFAYQKALTVFKTSKGENHPAVGSIFVRLADLYNKTGKIRESKSYCESALRIYEKPMPGVPPEEIASGLMDISAIYESMNDLDQALKLLPKALEIYKDAPGRQSTVAGIEAQMGVMNYMLGNYSESYNTLKNAISKLRATGEKKSAFFAVALNQMGLACVQRYALAEATELFEEAKNILEQEYGPYHHETLGVYSNLAGTYDAIGRVDEAIQILEYVVGMREERLGTANPDVDDEKRRLSELLKEAGRVGSRTARSLETLLDANAPSENNSNTVANVPQGDAI